MSKLKEYLESDDLLCVLFALLCILIAVVHMFIPDGPVKAVLGLLGALCGPILGFIIGYRYLQNHVRLIVREDDEWMYSTLEGTLREKQMALLAAVVCYRDLNQKAGVENCEIERDLQFIFAKAMNYDYKKQGGSDE